MSVLWPSPLVLDTQGPHSSDLFPTALPSITDAERVDDQIENGALTFHGLIDENVAALTGTVQGAVNWTFYNRILVIPSLIELGNLISAQSRTVSVWNGYLVGKSLTDFQTQNADGMGVFEPVTPPYSMRPLELLDYVLTISTDGPSAIDALLKWTIDGEEYITEVTGNRAVLFPFIANFRDDYNEGLEWKSDVLRSYDGSEQRRALRTKPRRDFNYKFSLFKDDSQLFRNLMFGWQNRVFAVPVWADRQVLASDQSAGDTVLSANPTNYSFAVGSPAVIYVSPTEYEVVEVESVGSTTITANNGLFQDWPAGTAVYPVVLAHLPVSVPINQLTDTVLEGDAAFMTSPDVTDPYMPDAAPPLTYDGKELITEQPNWVSPLDGSFDYRFNTIDGQVGPVDWRTTETTARNTRKYRWLFSDRARIRLFREFLARRRGQVKPFWVPSWTDDFTLVDNVNPGDSSIGVADNGFRTMIGTNTARDRIVVRLHNGTSYYRRITGVSVDLDGVTTRLILDAPLGVLVTPATVKAINMLNLCRLATDRVTISWKSDSVAVVETSLITVPA
jgi:hypothetical protein